MKNLGKLVADLQPTVLTDDNLNSLRGGRDNDHTTTTGTEDSDSNGDGVADDCNQVVDDPSIVLGTR